MTKTEFLTRFHHPRQILPEADFPLGTPGRPAAVLLPIVAREDQLTMLFTQRASHLRHHAGQVSFPGGKQETYDKNLLATALRETYEEIGLAVDNIEVIGSLPMFRTVSKFEVVPFVSIVKPPFELILDPNEVAEVFEVPLVYLLDQQNHLIHWIARKNYTHPIYFIPWEGKNIWGATASFIRHLSNHISNN
jgi:8-oxo-dGTP pyrophosphatase MutT (NUDIX family)